LTCIESPPARGVFAGLWESWNDPADGARVETFAIPTTTAMDVIVEVHDRMPITLDRDV
jgi:putative SOS response-associated peptidase YedK